MSFVLNEQSVFCPQLGSASCFLGMERPEVLWGWEHPLLAPLPIISFQRTWKPELWFSLGEFVGTEALEASGMTKGGRWRGRYDILVRLESKHYQILALASFSSEGTIVPSSPLYFPPSQRLRKENSGTGSRFILGYFEGRKVAERQSLPLSGSHSALPHCVLRLPRKPHNRSVICIFYFVNPPPPPANFRIPNQWECWQSPRRWARGGGV